MRRLCLGVLVVGVAVAGSPQRARGQDASPDHATPAAPETGTGADCPLHGSHARAADDPAPATSPYAGQQARSIKALSDDEVRGYLAGHGAGLARAAELNHYPGPRHVLDLSDELGLTDAQTAATRRAYERMRATVMPLGERYVAQERLLDELFARAEIDEATLRSVVSEAARLQAELRAAHLQAHLAMRELLDAGQIARYDELRGYR